MNTDKKKMVKIALFIFLVFAIGGFGGLFVSQYLVPKVSTNKYLSNIGLFRRAAENVTVINKTEQLIVKEDDSINKIAASASASVVNIISISKDERGNIFSKSGTGTILTSDGIVVTYAPVINEKASFDILLNNGSTYKATLIGIDRFTNLAYLKIDANNLPVIAFASPNEIVPGKKIIAIGNSFGEYQNRYASGLLSNINKTFNLGGMALASSDKLEGVYETDFFGQKEYLGGPIINFSGAFVGINGSLVIDNETRFFQIPVNVVKESLDRVMKNELSSRPDLGIYYISVTKQYAIANQMDRDRGALVYSPSGKQGLAIMANSIGEKSGIRINDLIIAVNKTEVNLDNPLSNLLSQYKKSDKIELLIIREGKEIMLPVQL